MVSIGSCVKKPASRNMFPLAVLVLGPPVYFYCRAITQTASQKLKIYAYHRLRALLVIPSITIYSQKCP
jgi:hypothetical protein